MKFVRQLSIAFISKISLLLLFVTVLFWIWQGAHINDYFPIQSIKIEGDYHHISKNNLKQITQPYVQDGFFAIDVSGLKDEILNLPWVKSVSVSRVWPDSIALVINEHKPVARWGHNSLVSDDAVVFTPDKNNIQQSLPELDGPAGQQQEVISLFEHMSQVLSRVGLTISILAMSKRHAIELKLTNGMQILLGKNQPLIRLKRFANVYKKVFESNTSTADRVDLRYPNGMAVHWKKNNLAT